MLPVYYDLGNLSTADVELAKMIWNHIANDTAPAYIEKIGNKDLKKYPTCVDWFTDIFYERLFDIHPVSVPYYWYYD